MSWLKGVGGGEGQQGSPGVFPLLPRSEWPGSAPWRVWWWRPWSRPWEACRCMCPGLTPGRPWWPGWTCSHSPAAPPTSLCSHLPWRSSSWWPGHSSVDMLTCWHVDMTHLAIVVPEDVLRPLERVDHTCDVDQWAGLEVNVGSPEDGRDGARVLWDVQSGLYLGCSRPRGWSYHSSIQSDHPYFDRVAVYLTLVVTEVLITEASYH